MPYTPRIRYGGELKHYRTIGSRNGIRRYQNLDGSLTAAGYARYNVDPNYQQKLEQQKRMTEQKLKQQQAQAQAQAQRNQPQRFQRPAQQAPKPYVSKEYQRESAYNSQKNNFSGTNKSAPKPSAQRTPTTANRNSSNMAPKPYKPTSSVGGGGSPYVSEEYQRDLAYNSQQNNFPNQNGNQEEDKDKGKKKAPKKPNISKPQAQQPQANEGKKKGGIGSWFSDRVNDARRAADSVGDAARGAASNVSKAASDAAKKAKEAADRAGDKAREAGGNAGNWLTDRIGDAKKAVSGAANNDSKAASDAAKKAKAAADRAGDKAPEAGGNAGNWLTDRIGDVKKAANQVGEAVLGSESKRNEYNAKADEYARKAKNPVRSMGYISDTDAARPSTWFDKDAGLTGRDYSQQIADQHRVYASKEAGYRQKAKEETFKGKAEKAGRNVGNWLTDRIGDAKGAASNARNAVSDAASRAKSTIEDIPYKVREAWNGDEYGGSSGKEQARIWKEDANRKRAQADRTYKRQMDRINSRDYESEADVGGVAKKASEKASSYAKKIGENKMSNEVSKATGREGAQHYGNKLNKYSRDAERARADVKKRANEAKSRDIENANWDHATGMHYAANADKTSRAWRKAYDDSIVGRAEKAGRNISRTASNVSRNVGKAASNAAGQIQTTAAESKRRAEQFIENFFGGNKKKKKK